MLSSRGQSNADQLDIPWRFAKGTTYDRDANPKGIVSFATAENTLVQKELEEFANKVRDCLCQSTSMQRYMQAPIYSRAKD
jgi:hypothetical protein